jgi:hypothetical protein
MAINTARMAEVQQVFNAFYDGFTRRHEGSKLPPDLIAGWLSASATMTLAYYTEGAGINVAGEIRDNGIGVQR